ncbi:interferon regulatory factor 4-like isoform X2 [Styela clava]|uniref:uncharacterized protein LOC120347510 isoform X2 n=1 Tax=Styela clava TaxID=7725 RepID=UPI00193A364D|nr:uncharacterized protein LOC120347510 isoform X2 [Styela clava]
MNTVDMFTKRVGSFAAQGYPMHPGDPVNSPPFIPANGLRNGMGFGGPGSPMGLAGMSPASSTSAFSSPPPPHMAVPSPQSSAGGKSEPPKRLRYWLVEMIENGQIPGLRWEDEGKTIFRIPWKHAGKNNWKEDDCRIFKAWAEHRGKYKEGVDKFDPATWKTRLRCALNKLPDIKELKERSQLEGTDPFRVYRLLPEPDRSQDFEIYPRSTWGRETYSPIGLQERQLRYSESVYGPPRPAYPEQYQRHGDPAMETMTSHHNPIMVQHPGIMSVANYQRRDDTIAPSSEFSRMRVKDNSHFPGTYERSKMTVIPPPEDDQEYEFQDHSIRPRLSNPHDQPPPEQHNMHGHRHNEVHRTSSDQRQQQHGNRGLPIDTSPALINPVSSPVGSESGQRIEPTPPQEPISFQPPSQMISTPDATPAAYEFDVDVRYRGVTVMTQHVSNHRGCRIHYGSSGLQHIATVAHELPSHVFGPQDLQQIELCEVEPWATFEKQVNLTKHLLKNVQRGLILSFQRDGTIVAKRLCQSRVFYLCPESKSNEPEKLERNNPTKVFDYKNFFYHMRRFAADQCKYDGANKSPSYEIKISFGQTWSMKNPLERNLISLVIIPSAAHFILNKVRERNNALISINNSILTSGPSSDDRLAERVTRDSEEYVDELISTLMRQEDGVGLQLDDVVKRPEDEYKPPGYYQQDVEMEVSAFEL